MSSDTILQEANELYQLQFNETLVDYSLHMGLMEKTANGKMIMASLNMKVLSQTDWFITLWWEVIMRLLIFVSSTGLVKLAIDSNVDHREEHEEGLKLCYDIGVMAYQFANFDSTSVFRTLNRLMMAFAIILFSLTTSNTTPCEHMNRFKERIKPRLITDYYLWCLLFAMDFVLTFTSNIHINLENEYGIHLNLMHAILTSFCVLHLSGSMQLIGNGRLTPLIIGTPLLFLDAGDDITLAKSAVLFLYYLSFWCSNWRELVDWNHPMLCEAGVCRLLCNQHSSLRQSVIAAKSKFDMWRSEEGLDHEGWFVVLDLPTPSQNRSSVQLSNISDRGNSGGQEQQGGQQISDYTGRVIYLPSRHPLLTSLAAVILIVWK